MVVRFLGLRGLRNGWWVTVMVEPEGISSKMEFLRRFWFMVSAPLQSKLELLWQLWHNIYRNVKDFVDFIYISFLINHIVYTTISQSLRAVIFLLLC